MSDFESKVRIDIDASQALAQIKLLQRQISDFHSSMAKGSATANLKSLQMQQSLVDTINATGQYSAQMKTVASSTQAFTTSLEKNKLSLNQYFRYAGGASRSFGKFFKTEMDTIQKVAIERVKDLQTQYIKMGRDASGALRTIAVRPLALDMENLSTKTQIAAQKQQLLNQLLKQGSTNLLNFGKNTQWAGRQLMVGFSIPLGILGATAAKTFMDMEKQAIAFKRVYGDTFTASAETDKMLKQVQNLASEFTKYGVAVDKTMESAAKAAATGKMGADLLAQVSESTRLSVLGSVDQQKALETTISLTNAFGISTDELRGKINFLNAVENQTVTSIEDLTTAIPKAAPVIKQLGGNVEDLSFFLTAMREGGINASEGANALKSGLAALINPTGKASKMLESFGINISSIVEKNKGDVKNLVIDFAKALDTLDPLNRARAIEQLFGKFQFSRLSTLFQNVIKDGSQAARVLELTKQTSAELGILAQRELSRISSSPMYKFQKAVADFKKELAPVGEEFLKAVTPLIQFGTDVLKSFNNLDGGIKQFIITTTGVIAGLGPIMLMTFGLIANGVANLIKGFSFVKSVFNKTTTASQVLGETTNYLTQQQLEAAAVAASLDQVHNKLTQSFTVEARAVANLAAQYQKAISAQVAFSGVPVRGGKAKPAPKKYASGIFSVPGPKGAGDIVPAMLSPGEAVIPAGPAQKYRGFIKGMIAGKIPGFEQGNNYVDAFQRKARSAPDAINRQTQKMNWDTFDIEQQAAMDEIETIIKEQNLSQSKADNLRKNYTGKEAAHTAPATRTVKIGNRTAQQKIFNSKTVTPDARVFNQAFANLIEKRVGIPGKTYSTGSSIGDILSDDKKLREMAKSVGIPVSTLKKELQKFDPMRPGGAQYPTSKNAWKAFEAVSRVSNDNPGRIAAAALGVRNANYGKPGTREAAIAAGGLRYNPAEDAKAAQQEETLRKRFDDKARASTTGSKDAKKAKAARTNNTKAVNKNTAAVKKDTAEVEKGTKSKSQSSKTKSKTTLAATTSVTEQLNNGVTRITKADGRVDYKVNNRYANAEMAQALANETALPKKTSRLAKAGSFLSRRGVLGGAGMAASMGGSMMGGDVGNTIANVGNAAFIADVGRSFIPAGAKTKLATFGVEKLLPTLTKLAPMFLKLTVVLGLATTAYQIFTASAQKQADISKAVVDTLSMNKDKLDKVNEFFGTDAKLSGIRALSVVGAGETGKQASLAEQFRTSDQFKSLYGDQASQLRGASDRQFAITMQSLALDLYGSGVGEEQVQIIIDAIKKEAKKTNVVLKFKDLKLDTETGKQNLAKSVEEITDGIVIELKSQKDWLGLNWLANANVEAYTSQISGFISALSQEFEKGRISVKEFESSFSQIEQSFIKAETANPGDGIVYLNQVLQKTNPEIAFAAAGIANLNNRLMVTKLAAKGAAMSAQLLADVAIEDAGALSYLEGLEKFENDKNAKLIKQQKIIAGITNQQKNLQKQETAVNDLYDKRITALERIDSLNQSISDRQKNQLDLADALSQGDVFRAAQAMQQIRADQAKVALDQQKNILQDARDKQAGALQNKQDTLDGSLSSAQQKLSDISESTFKLYDGVANKSTVDKMFAQYGFLFRFTSINRLFADEATLREEFGKAVTAQALTDKKSKDKKSGGGGGGGGGHATGGHISGPGSGTSDSIPARLSNGEYVIRAKAVNALGTDTLDKLNHAEKFAKGGMVRGYAPGGPVVKTDTSSDLGIDWFNSFVQNLLGGGNPTSFMQNDKTKNTFVSAYNQGAKNAGIDFTDPLFYTNFMPFLGIGAIKGLKGMLGGLKSAKVAKPFTGMGSNTELNKIVSSTFTKNNIKVGEDLYPTYNVGKGKFAFQGYNQKLPGVLSATGVKVVPMTPEGLLEAAIGLNPKNKALKVMLKNFKENKIGQKELDLLDNIHASMSITKKGRVGEFKRADGLATMLSALSGNKTAKGIIDFKTQKLKNIVSAEDARKADIFETYDKNKVSGDGQIAVPANVPFVRSLQGPLDIDKNGNALVYSASNYRGDYARASIHGTTDAIVANHASGGWDPMATKIVSPLSEMIRTNGLPRSMDVADTWWLRNPGQPLVFPKGAYSQIHSFDSNAKLSAKLVKRGIIKPGATVPIISYDPATKEVFRLIKTNVEDYTEAQQELLRSQYGQGLLPGYNIVDTLDDIALDVAKRQHGIVTGYQGSLHGYHFSNTARAQEIRNLATSLGVRSKGATAHSDSIEASSEKGIHSLGINNKTAELRNQLSSIDALELIRTVARLGHFKGQKINPRLRESRSERMSGFRKGITNLAKGGMVNVPQFKTGGMFRTGYADGGLAMLHDKEFVMNPGAVKEYGVDKLKAMNNGTYNNGSVYNSYGVNINVGGSNSNASDIARTVIREIKKIDSQQIRSTKV